MRPLLNRYPNLDLAHTAVCELPTPIVQTAEELYIKRDDISAPLFGGNKARTLEFLLPAATDLNVVIGLPGTSMALASAIHTNRHGIPLIVLLIDQTTTAQAQTNLRYFQHLGADIRLVSGPAALNDTISQIAREHDQPPFIFGASAPLGMCGYINAAFELAAQVEAGLLPEPKRLYIAMGLMGTATGLMLGLKAAGLATEVIPVVAHPLTPDQRDQRQQQMIDLFDSAVAFLRERDASFPALTFDPIRLISESPEAPRALAAEGLARQAEVPTRLEATWTAPTYAALRRDHPSGPTLFWHTQNSQRYPAAVHAVDWRDLPPDFHRYFTAEELAISNHPLRMP